MVQIQKVHLKKFRFFRLKNSVKTGINKNQKVPDLDPVVGVTVCPIKALKAFGDLPNSYEILHYLGGTLHLS